MSSTKRCSICRMDKEMALFYKKKSAVSGYASECKECTKERQLKYASENREKEKQRSKAWYDAHPHEVRERRRRIYESNGESIRAQVKKWREDNPEKDRALSRNKNARKRNAEGTFSAADIATKIITQNNCCFYCGKAFGSEGYHVDHNTPLSRGGSNWPENLVLACPSCNMHKHTKTGNEFLQIDCALPPCEPIKLMLVS